MGKDCSVHKQRYLTELNMSSYPTKFQTSDNMSEDWENNNCRENKIWVFSQPTHPPSVNQLSIKIAS